jgi:hypothetical protein
MSKQGSLDPIILLVISFSVINYVVSRASACDRPTFLFYTREPGIKKKVYPLRFALPPRGPDEGAAPPQTPQVASLRILPGYKKESLPPALRADFLID